LEQAKFDLVISDFTLPSYSGMAALVACKKLQPDTPFIFVSGTIGEEGAVEGLKSGATDYLLKGRLNRLGQAVKRALQEAQARAERKRLEAQFIEAQKMEAIGQLAGGVAHDFNNLLMVIHGNVELVLNSDGQLNEQNRQCLKRVTAASERATNLVRQLLAFSRKQVIQFQPFNLNNVIVNLTKMLNRIIGENISLQCAYADNLPFVYADTGMIEQVLLNLIVNARDAMPQGGSLLISTKAASIGETYVAAHPEARPGEFVCVTVSDTGTGIAPEYLPRIFEPFFTTKEVGKGTGLGLATVYGIVKQHQGWVEVSSRPGNGTIFKIFLPANYSPGKKELARKTKAKTQGGHEKILLVEDDADVRIFLRQALEKAGYQIWEAGNGMEALNIWNANKSQFDLLLTDIIMPGGITGAKLAEQLKKERTNLKVVLMSGYNPDVAGKIQARGHFLQKPCSLEILAETVRQCLDDNQ
jgi:two-component system cell cycle sensor histidine kinase/response regulator CckA